MPKRKKISDFIQGKIDQKAAAAAPPKKEVPIVRKRHVSKARKEASPREGERQGKEETRRKTFTSVLNQQGAPFRGAPSIARLTERSDADRYKAD